MSKNIRHGLLMADITLALPVPTGTLAGDVVAVGTAGLYGFTITPRATTDSIATGDSAPGLKDGQASVRLLPAQIVAELPVASSAAFAIGDAVYGSQAGSGVVTYSATSTGYFVGRVTGKPSGTSLDVYLGGNAPAPTGD